MFATMLTVIMLAAALAIGSAAPLKQSEVQELEAFLKTASKQQDQGLPVGSYLRGLLDIVRAQVTAPTAVEDSPLVPVIERNKYKAPLRPFANPEPTGQRQQEFVPPVQDLPEWANLNHLGGKTNPTRGIVRMPTARPPLIPGATVQLVVRPPSPRPPLVPDGPSEQIYTGNDPRPPVVPVERQSDKLLGLLEEVARINEESAQEESPIRVIVPTAQIYTGNDARPPVVPVERQSDELLGLLEEVARINEESAQEESPIRVIVPTARPPRVQQEPHEPKSELTAEDRLALLRIFLQRAATQGLDQEAQEQFIGLAAGILAPHVVNGVMTYGPSVYHSARKFIG